MSVLITHCRLKINSKGFTLVELIIAIGFFGLISALLMYNLLMVYRTRGVIQAQKQAGTEMTVLLNHSLAGLIRSGFAIDYKQTKAEVINSETEGMQNQVDELVVFTDRAETQFFKVYRQDYQAEGDMADTAQLMLQFNNSEPIALHSSQMVVEAFDISVPPPPLETGDHDLQPYVQLYVRARPRKNDGESLANVREDVARFSPMAYRTTFSLRNTQQSQYKT